MSNQRDSTLDKLKGVLILLVIFGHITFVGTSQYELSVIKSFIYIFHMPIFLMLSGYFFSPILTNNRLYQFFRNIILPYTIFYSMYLVMLYIFSKENIIPTSNNIEHWSDYTYYLIVEPLASYWYLHTIILFSLMYSLSYIVLNRFMRKKNSLILSSVIVYLIVCYLEQEGVKVRDWVFIYLILGVFFREYFTLDIIKNDKRYLILSILAVALILINFSLLVINSNHWVRFSFSISVFIILINIFSFIEIPFINALGKGTIILFLLHVYPLNFMKFFVDYSLTVDSSGVTYAIFSMVFAVLSPILFVFITDKLSISKVLFGKDNVIRIMK